MLAFNPWKTMWTSPRSTIREISDVNPNYRLFFLCWIYGFGSLFSLAQTFSLGFVLSLLLIVLLGVILAPIWGYIVFNISSFFLLFTGKWLGGKANYQQIRAAIAWSNVPMLINVGIWAILLVLFGPHLFQDFPGSYFLSGLEFWLLFVFMVTQMIISIWVLVLYIIALSEVQEFSVLRAIFNVIIAALSVGVIFFVIFFVYHLLIGASYEAI